MNPDLIYNNSTDDNIGRVGTVYIGHDEERETIRVVVGISWMRREREYDTITMYESKNKKLG